MACPLCRAVVLIERAFQRLEFAQTWVSASAAPPASLGHYLSVATSMFMQLWSLLELPRRCGPCV